MVVFSAVLPAISSPDLGNAPVVGNGAIVFSSFIFTVSQAPEGTAFPYTFPLSLS